MLPIGYIRSAAELRPRASGLEAPLSRASSDTTSLGVRVQPRLQGTRNAGSLGVVQTFAQVFRVV